MRAMDRREFVTVCACAGATLLFTGCVSLVTHPVPVSDSRVRLALRSYPELSKPDGAIKIQPIGHADPIYVLRMPNDYAAVSPICTHRGCTVDVQGARLVCPCHGSTYDRSGSVLRGPAERSLTRFEITQEGEELVIDLRTAPSR